MTWALTIILILDGVASAMQVGLMIDAATCDLAGSLLAQSVSLAAPGHLVIWTCEQAGVAA